MLGIFIVFLLLWAALTVILFAGTSWLQGYIYSESEPGMAWRAPAVASVLTLVAIVWAMFDYHSIKTPDQAAGSYTSLFNLTTDQSKQYNELWAMQAGKKTHYKLQKSATGQPQYRDLAGRPLPTRVETIIVNEDGQEIRFEADRDAQGNFKSDPQRGLRYSDSAGREMREHSLGEVTTSQSGLFLANLLLSLIHMAAWFLTLWLLLRFQWHHALGLAVIFWLVMTLLIMPMILSRVEEVAKARIRAAQAVSGEQG